MDFDEWCICNFLIVSIYDKWWMLVNNLFTLIIYIGWIYDKWWMLVEYDSFISGLYMFMFVQNDTSWLKMTSFLIVIGAPPCARNRREVHHAWSCFRQRSPRPFYGERSGNVYRQFDVLFIMTKLVTNNSVYILTDAPPIADEGPHEGSSNAYDERYTPYFRRAWLLGFMLQFKR